jgi:potassium efflux system protein
MGYDMFAERISSRLQQLLSAIALLALAGIAGAAPVTLPPEAAAWLADHGPVKLAPDPDFAPIEFVDSHGRHRGLSADLTEMLGERTGMDFQLVIKDRFEDVLAALDAGEIDVASSVFKSPSRAERFLFTTPYLRLPAAFIGRRGGPMVSGVADLRGRKVAVVRGHVWQELLADAGYRDVQLPFASVSEALAAVASGAADIYAGDLLSADHVMRSAELVDVLVVSGESRLEAQLAFAVRRDLPQLKAALDLALASITVSDEKQLRERWESVTAMPEPDVEAEISGRLTDEIVDLRRLLEARTDLAESERKALNERLDAAARFDAAAEESVARIERIRRDAGQAALEASTLQSATLPASTAESVLRWRGSLPQRATIEQLEQLLAVERSGRDSLREGVQRSAEQIKELQQRPLTLRREMVDLRTRLDGLVVPPESADLRVMVDRIAVLAETRALRAALAASVAEQTHADALLQAAEARRRDRQRLLAERSERVTILEQLVAERGDNQMAEELSVLRASAQVHAEAVREVRDLANANVASGEALVTGMRRLAALREQASTIDASATEIASTLRNARARIEIGGVTESVGMLLLAERRRLPSEQTHQARLTKLQREAAEVRLSQITVSEEIERLRDLGGVLAELTAGDGSGPPLPPEARAVLSELLLVRNDLLPRQMQLQQRMLDSLRQSEERLVELMADSQALTQLMDQNLLWIPSHPPVDINWVRQVAGAWQDLVSVERWRPTAILVGERLRKNPLWIIALLVPVAMVVLRRRLIAALTERGARVRDLSGDRMRHTLEALALTALIALPPALLLALVGNMLKSMGEAGSATHYLGIAIRYIVPYVYLFAAVAAFCRENGMAHVHLRWLDARREALLRVLPWLQFAMMPLALAMALSLVLAVENGIVLRSAAVVLMLMTAAIAAWLLAPGRLFASRVAGADPRPLTRRALRVGLVGWFLAMTVIALLGFVVTVATLYRVFLDTLQVLFAVTLVHGLALRWLMLGERRIALVQQPSAGEADIGANAEEARTVAVGVNNLRTIGNQSRTLLRALTVVLIGAGLLWSMSAVAPAFTMLDNVALWETEEMVEGVVQPGFISLGDVMLALLVLALGSVAASNIPGLLEILLQNSFTKDASVRYGAVAVTRYLIVIALIFTVFGLIGVRWSDLQWLAAAISVGLGFGLQEIFANFVAGLILLFERPFRVGDVVNIGELSGTVRRVQTRATTVVDWDGKDIIIPNKAFITERFVNWTLSDTVTRIVIKVGVSHNSNPEQVREELLGLARAHPAVHYDPPPNALLMQVSPSTLDFELRCFVREIDDRLRTMDDLNSRILRRFRERGILIAYPQMDVHVHRPPAGATPDGSAGGAMPGD